MVALSMSLALPVQKSSGMFPDFVQPPVVAPPDPTDEPLSAGGAPVISGVARVGESLTASAGVWGGSRGRTLSFQWRRNGVDIPGQSAPDYVIVPGDDGFALSVAVVADDGVDSLAQVSDPTEVVTFPAPTSASGLADVTLVQGAGDLVVDAAQDFAGATGGAWSVTGPGAVVDADGQVTLSSATLRAAATVVVSYSNSGGSASSAFQYTVHAPPAQMEAPVLVAGETSVSVTLGADPDDNNAPITRRDIRYSADEATWTVVAGVAATQDITGLTAGTVYFVQARAVNAVGSGAWSASAQATTSAAQSLAIATTDGTAAIEAGAESLSLTVADTGIYDGTFTLNPADLDTGPVNLVAPVLSQPDGPAGVINARPGLWVHLETAPPAVSYQWTRDGTSIANATGPSYQPSAEDAGREVRVRETAAASNGSRTAASLAVLPQVPSTPVSSIELLRVGGFQSSAAPTDVPSFTLDLSAAQAGDQLLVFYGTNQVATGMTLDGQAAQLLAATDASSDAGRMAAFGLSLSGAGSAAAEVAFALPAGANHHVISAHLIRNGAFGPASAASSTVGGTLSVSVAPQTAANAVMACAMGPSFRDLDIAWSGAGVIDTALMTTASTRAVSIASAQNVATGGHTVSGTPSTQNHTSLIAVALTEAS